MSAKQIKSKEHAAKLTEYTVSGKGGEAGYFVLPPYAPAKLGPFETEQEAKDAAADLNSLKRVKGAAMLLLGACQHVVRVADASLADEEQRFAEIDRSVIEFVRQTIARAETGKPAEPIQGGAV